MSLLADPWFVAAALVATCLMGLSKGGFFGLGVMALPILSLLVPPLHAASILLPTGIAQDALTIWTYRRTWSAWNLKVMIPGMVVGMGLAWLLAASLDAAHIRLMVGVIATLFVLRQWLSIYLADRMPKPNSTTGVIFGMLGGFTTMLANAGGPVWQLHLLPQRLEKLTYVGTVTMLFATSNLIKIPGYGALGLFTTENLVAGIALLPVALAANYAGIWLVRRTSTELFYRFAYIIMFFIAVELMRSSITELWWH